MIVEYSAVSVTSILYPTTKAQGLLWKRGKKDGSLGRTGAKHSLLDVTQQDRYTYELTAVVVVCTRPAQGQVIQNCNKEWGQLTSLLQNQ